MASHPPAPGPFVQPSFLGVEEALEHVTFPISKKDLLEQLVDGESALLDGRNIDLRELVKDLHDDFFDTEEELHTALERTFGARDEEASDIEGHAVAERDERAWNDPVQGGERGRSDVASYMDAEP